MSRTVAYFRWVMYNVFELISCLINTTLSIFGLHTYISWGTDFMAWIEANRIVKEIDARTQKRDFQAMEAESKSNEAKKELEQLGGEVL